MSTEPKKEESDKQKTEDVEVKMVPEGTFAGTIQKPILVKDGEPIPEDTADQGEMDMKRSFCCCCISEIPIAAHVVLSEWIIKVN